MTLRRKTRLGLLSGTGLLIGAATVVLIHLAADRLFLRWDWTQGQRYSLSPASRALLKSLPDPVKFRFYLSPGLPQPYESQGRYVRDLLNEYAAAARGRVSVEIKSVDTSTELLMEMRRVGVAPSRFTQVGSDQFQVREGYLGLLILYQDKQDVIPFIAQTENLEYEISTRLRAMTQPTKKRLVFITNHNEVSAAQMATGPFGRLLSDYDAQDASLPLAADGPRPDALLMLGPQKGLSTEEIASWDRWVSSGVPAVVALNRRLVYPQNFRSMAQVTALEPWLEHYGVAVSRDFVMDETCQNVAMQSGQNTFLVKFLPFPLATDLKRDHPATRDTDAVGLPFAHPLSFNLTDGASLRGAVLARSSPRSWTWTDFYNVDPPNVFEQIKTDPPSTFAASGRSSQLGPFPLIVTVDGSTTAYSSPATPAQVKLTVIGTAFFARPEVPNPEGNVNFMQSLLQWMTQDKNFLAIPSRGSPFRPLRPVGNGHRLFVKFAGYFLIPLLIVLAGFLHWRHREGQRAVVAGLYRPTAPPPEEPRA